MRITGSKKGGNRNSSKTTVYMGTDMQEWPKYYFHFLEIIAFKRLYACKSGPSQVNPLLHIHSRKKADQVDLGHPK